MELTNTYEEDQETEINEDLKTMEQYTDISVDMTPPLDDFLHTPRCNAQPVLHDQLIKTDIIVDELLSDSFLHKMGQWWAVRASAKAATKQKKEFIKKSVRSYVRSFYNFNYGQTYFQKDPTGTDYVRASTKCMTNRNIRHPFKFD